VLTAIGSVLMVLALISAVLAGASVIEGSGDGFGDGLTWAFCLGLCGVAVLCCSGDLSIK
jgi:hypothetical protein